MNSSACISSNSSFRPEPDCRFPRSVDSSGGGGRGEVMVVDSKSCRQLYLRTAYTFTRQEENEKDGIEKAKKCLEKVKERVIMGCKKDHHNHHATKSLKFTRNSNNNNKSIVIFSKVKESSYASVMSMVRRMLACTAAKVDVADH